MEVVSPSAPGAGGDGGPPGGGGDDPEWIARMLKRMHERGMAEYRNTKQAMKRNRVNGFEDVNVIIVTAAGEGANPQPAEAAQIPEAMAAPDTHAPAATDEQPAAHMHTSYEMAATHAPAATDEAPAATDEQPAAAEAPAAPGPAEAAAEAPAAPEPAEPMLIIDEETDVCTNRHIYVTNLNEVCCFDCVWCLLSVVC